MKAKAKDLRKLSAEELTKELAAAQEGLYRLRFQSVVEEVTDKTIISQTKKKIARIKTIQKERGLSQEKTA